MPMLMDDKFQQKLQDWLNTEPAQRNFDDGALMMLQLNHNKILYQTVLLRPDKYMDKVEYELRKFLKMHLDNKTAQDVVKMEKEIVPLISKTIAENAPVISSDDDVSLPQTIAKGKREDHDQLPEQIQVLWNENGPIYFKIKELFETLKGLEDAQPCDRYEYLVQLKDLDTKYRKNMALYDRYVITDAQDAQTKAESESDDAADMFKKASAARTYISDNKRKLEALNQKRIESENDEASLKDIEAEYAKILGKVQTRYNWLVENGLNVSDEQLEALKQLGLIV